MDDDTLKKLEALTVKYMGGGSPTAYIKTASQLIGEVRTRSTFLARVGLLGRVNTRVCTHPEFCVAMIRSPVSTQYSAKVRYDRNTQLNIWVLSSTIFSQFLNVGDILPNTLMVPCVGVCVRARVRAVYGSFVGQQLHEIVVGK